MKQNYLVEITVTIGEESAEMYINVKANSQHEAHLEAVKIVNSTTNIKVEKKPTESILQDNHFNF